MPVQTSTCKLALETYRWQLTVTPFRHGGVADLQSKAYDKYNCVFNLEFRFVQLSFRLFYEKCLLGPYVHHVFLTRGRRAFAEQSTSLQAASDLRAYCVYIATNTRRRRV